MEDLEAKPKPSDLQRVVKPLVASRWEEIGTALGLADEDAGEKLDEIYEKRKGDVGMCFNDVMKLWLRSNSHSYPVTWATLIKAIKSIEGLESAGAQIETQLLSTKEREPSTTPQGHVATGTLPSLPAAATPAVAAQPMSDETMPIDLVTNPTSDGSSSVDPPSDPIEEKTLETNLECTSSISSPPKVADSELEHDSSSLSQTQDNISDTFQARGEKKENEPSDANQAEGEKEEEDISDPNQAEGDNLDHSFDFSVKLDPGREVRSYQLELAKPGMDGENYIVVAPTGSGKTLVAALVISDHLSKNQHNDDKPKVVFIVNTKPLAEQQKRELERFIPGAHVECSMGDGGQAVFDLLPHNDVIVCTAGKLLDAIRSGKVSFDKISLVVIDECHHTKKGSPQANVMLRYLEQKERDPTKVPQIMGLTASPGAGDNPHLDEDKTIDHLVNLCALMDATRGIKIVEEHIDELDRNTNNPSSTLELPQGRNPNEPFIQIVIHEMEKLEKSLPDFKCSFQRWSQEYETTVQQQKQPLELNTNPKVRDQISTLRLLRCYSQALNMYMDLNPVDAITVLEEYTGLPAEDARATPREKELKKNLQELREHLKRLELIENPQLNAVKEKLCDAFSQNPTSKGIVFVRTKKHALSLCKWIDNLAIFQEHRIKPRILTGHTRDTGAGMTQVEQQEVMKSFREGKCNLLVATSVAEEGLDVPACNLVIRFHHVSNEIAKTQTRGRARAEESEAFTILPSDSRKKNQELKNEELLKLVEVCMKWFPKGRHLVTKITEKQKVILTQHRQRISYRKQIAAMHDRNNYQLLCKSCKIPACSGSDVYIIDNTNHHAVPDEAFKEKITKRPHKKPGHLTITMEYKYKIFCRGCDSEWGIMATWPEKGKEFPVLKCKQFIFESKGEVVSIGKWSDAPFDLAPLSEWQDSQNESDDSNSE